MSAGKAGEQWQAGKSMLDCHKYMLDNEIATDIKFVFPTDGQRTSVTMCAHRFVLICRSPVFEAMLTNDSYAEACSEVNIVDISPAVFKELLRYIYYEEIDLSGDNILQVLYAAKKYFMDGLIKRCHDFLREEMTADNVCVIINNAVMFTENNLVQICLGYIAAHVHEVFESKEFNKLSQSALYEILRCTGIGYELEIDIFSHCMKWARYQLLTDKDSTLRQILGKCLHEIRFSKMVAKELAHAIANEPDILTFEEQANYFRHIADPQAGLVKNMNQISRDLREFRVDRFPFTRDGAKQPIKENIDEDVLTFVVDKVVNLRGISTYGCASKGTSYDLDIVIVSSGSEGRTLKDKAKIISDGSCSPVQIREPFGNPYMLVPDVLYTMTLLCMGGGQRRFYGFNGWDDVQMEGVSVRFESPKSGKTTVRGRIAQLLFTKVQ